MSVSKTIARKLILPLAVSLEVDNHYLKKAGRSCCIINFHGVRRHDTGVFNNRHMIASEFEKMIVYLKKRFAIVPLSEAFEIHRSKQKMPRRTVALSFDDGYVNNFEVALPILKKHGVPATFYIISKGLTETDYVSWPDVIDVIRAYHQKDLTVNGHVFSFPSFYNKALGLDLLSYLKTCGNQAESLAYGLLNGFSYLEKELKRAPELLQLISGQAITGYAAEPLLEFGAHSHSHFNMEYLDMATARAELKQSLEILEHRTGKKVISFAFPDGSYLPETVTLAKELGYKNMAAVEYRYNERNADPNLLSRFTISNSTTWQSNALRLSKQFDLFGFN